jgi:23S rRNA (cytidine1920-2'-O)/16S rRNA (cytidine1409-2'-O)-methyltransferase
VPDEAGDGRGPADARLDAILVARGLARSRTHAARLIADGLVTVDGAAQVKPAFRVRAGQVVEVAASDHYVSRGAHKLIAALDAFGIDPAGRIALDAGASTGGFSHVLLERGASRILAIDVGHGQLVSKIRDNPAVTSVEGFNIRELTLDWVAEQLRSPEFWKSESASNASQGTRVGSRLPSLVVADLSFISLKLVLEPLRDSAEPGADFVLLVKPQFEVGRGGIREGIVRDRDARQDAVSAILWAAWDLGLPTAGVIPSPIAGTAGNREYLVWLNVGKGTNPSEWNNVVRGLE